MTRTFEQHSQYAKGWNDCVDYIRTNAPSHSQQSDNQVDGWQIALKVREALDRKACPDAFMKIAVEEIERLLCAAPPLSQQSAPIPWIPVLRNRADGVDGHYAIGRFNPSGYWEFWNLISHKWASASNKVLSLDEANDLLKQLVFPSHESEQGGES